MLHIVDLAMLFLPARQIWAAGTQQDMLAQIQGAATAVLSSIPAAVTLGTIRVPA